MCKDLHLFPKDSLLRNQDSTLPVCCYSSHHGLTILEDTPYFIPTVSSDFSGVASIYRIDSFEEDYSFLDNHSLLEAGATITPIYDVNLNNHDTSILGLETVNDYLIVIMLINDQLVFRSIDPLNGTVISEASTNPLNSHTLNILTH